MANDDYVIVGKGEAIPKARPHPRGPRTGDKKGYFPPKPILSQKGEPQTLQFGKARRVSGGYVATVYGSPAYAPVHQERSTGKVYSSVFHKWDARYIKPSRIKPMPNGVVFDQAQLVGKNSAQAKRLGVSWSNSELAHGVKDLTRSETETD